MVIAVGIDIAKRTHEACFMSQGGQELRKIRRFGNTRRGVQALLDDLQRTQVTHRVPALTSH